MNFFFFGFLKAIDKSNPKLWIPLRLNFEISSSFHIGVRW